ncbi:MAG: hypothetical protein AB7T18_14945 [Alphaproteobacteria bacterium]
MKAETTAEWPTAPMEEHVSLHSDMRKQIPLHRSGSWETDELTVDLRFEVTS